MWLFSSEGMFSVVEKPGDAQDGVLTVRGRVRADLVKLGKLLPSKPKIVSTPVNDYPYRIRAPREELALAAAQMVRDLHYENFKLNVAQRQGAKRESVYHRVWAALLALHRP